MEAEMTSTKADSDYADEPTNCVKCDQPFLPRVVRFMNRVAFKAQYCPLCVEAYETDEAVKAANQKQAETPWHRTCPPLYRDTDPKRINADKLSRVLAWNNGPNGLVLHGPSGRCKTRAMWLLLRRLMDNEQLSVRIHDSVSFGHECAEAFGNQTGERWLFGVCNAPVWFIDDLGQFKLTERVEEALWTVMERRTRNRLPVLTTTQWVGAELENRFTELERGRAIVRRLREFCHTVRL